MGSCGRPSPAGLPARPPADPPSPAALSPRPPPTVLASGVPRGARPCRLLPRPAARAGSRAAWWPAQRAGRPPARGDAPGRALVSLGVRLGTHVCPQTPPVSPPFPSSYCVLRPRLRPRDCTWPPTCARTTHLCLLALTCQRTGPPPPSRPTQAVGLPPPRGVCCSRPVSLMASFLRSGLGSRPPSEAT